MGKKKQVAKKTDLKKKGSTINYSLSTRDYIAIALILLITFVCYNTILSNDLVNWDDERYIQNNPIIVSIDLKALFSTFIMGNYHPLTMLAYAIEYQFFDLNPTGYHFISLLLHLLNVLLVFSVVFHLSNKTTVALIVSFFFGIHPMHVESVAWASELKDLLYSFFFLSAYLFYIKYLKNQTQRSYYFSILLFICSLLSKGMAVSLPVVLLLTDYFKGRKLTKKALIEKIPFFIIAIIFGIVAVYAQKSLGATESTVFPLPQRIVFAGYAFAAYLVKLIVPFNLSSYYPYPIKVGGVIPWPYYLYMLVALGLSVYIFYFHRHSKKIFFGIAFFAATILFVLQLLPVGDTIISDRYSYIPSIGLFYLAGEGFYWLWRNKKKPLSIMLLAAFAIFFTVQTYSRCRVWKNSLTLWNDVINKHNTVATAYYNRGIYLLNDNHEKEALDDFNRAIELKADYADAYNNRGSLFIKEGKMEEALNDLNKAISFNPNLAQGHFNRGFIFYQKRRYADAILDYNKVIELKPDTDKLAAVYNLMALVFMNQKEYEQALDNLNKAIELKPSFAEAINNRGSLFNSRGKYEDAIRDFSAAIGFRSNYAEAYFNRGIAASNSGKKDLACQDWQRAAGLGYQAALESYQKNCH